MLHHQHNVLGIRARAILKLCDGNLQLAFAAMNFGSAQHGSQVRTPAELEEMRRRRACDELNFHVQPLSPHGPVRRLVQLLSGGHHLRLKQGPNSNDYKRFKPMAQAQRPDLAISARRPFAPAAEAGQYFDQPGRIVESACCNNPGQLRKDLPAGHVPHKPGLFFI
jgi:hypothetical protein